MWRKRRGGRPFAALVALAALAPLNVSGVTDPWTDVQLRPLLILGLAIGLMLTFWRRFGETGHPFDRVDGLGFVLLGAIWLSAALSDMPSYGAAGAARSSVAVLMITATRNMVHSRAQAIAVLRAMAIGALGGAIIGLVVLAVGQDIVGDQYLVGSITELGPWDRLTRPWLHANVAAMALGATGAAVVLFRHHAVAIFALVLIIVAMVLTYSRGGLVAAAAAMLLWTALRQRRFEAAIAVGLVSVGLLTMVVAPAWNVRLEQPGDQAWYSAQIEAAPLVLDGTGGFVEVTVVNDSLVTWHSQGREPVKLSARWLDRTNGEIWGEHLWQLPQSLEPGDSMTGSFWANPSIPDGEYDVRWDLTIPFLAYFGQFLGDEPVLSSGSVTDSPVERGNIEPTPLVVRAINLERGEIRRLAWDTFVENPALGVGPLQLSTANDQLTAADRLPGGHAHNILLEALVSWGLVGTIPLLVLAVGALVRAGGLAWRDKDPIATVIAVSLTAVGVHGLVDWPLVFVAVGIPIGILIGLGWSAQRWARDVSV